MALPNDSEFEELEKWLYENYFTPFEEIEEEELKTNVFRINQESDSIFSNIGGNQMEFAFVSMLFGNEMRNVAHKRQQQQVFDEMMKESTGIRRQTVNANRSSGWGRNTGKYNPKNKKNDELPYKDFNDGDWFYKGKPITHDEAKKLFKEYNDKKNV